MAIPTLPALRRQFDEIASEYDARFAGQSRVTRDVAQLDSILNRLRALRAQVDALPRATPAADVATLKQDVKQSLELYETERKMILQARTLGGTYAEFAALGGDANLVFAAYHRHFAGKSRPTRDLGLLAEMIDDLTRIKEAMEDLIGQLPAAVPGNGGRDDLTLVTDNLKMYVTERGEIVEARNGGTASDQASVLAELANGQFRVYETHFAGRSRLTRRPALLQRVIDNLAHVQDRMRLLQQQGLASESNDRNLGIVEGALAQYRQELGEIRKTREATKLVDIMSALGGAANEVMEDYGKGFEGQERRTRDLTVLSNLCDRMGEVGRQMSDFDRVESNEMNSRNLGIVTSNRVMLEREYTLIETAKGPAPA